MRPIGCCCIPTGKSIAKGWTWRSRVPTRALERLELLTGNLVRAVLCGRGGNITSLPDAASDKTRSEKPRLGRTAGAACIASKRASSPARQLSKDMSQHSGRRWTAEMHAAQETLIGQPYCGGYRGTLSRPPG